jgi:hypothetical protein
MGSLATVGRERAARRLGPAEEEAGVVPPDMKKEAARW